MSTRAAALAVEITSDADLSGFGAASAAAKSTGTDIAHMGDQAEQSARGLRVSADAADDMAGKTGKATGALGALAGGLSAVGLEKYAGGLQAAAVATDFASGAGDAMNLVMESTILKNIKTTATTIAKTAAEKAAAAGTAVMTAAQWALNAAMSANPIGLIIIGLVALVALFVVLWKKSDTFREIVTGAFEAVKGAAAAAFNWVKSNWPLLLAIITGPIGLAVLAVVKNWDAIKEAVSTTKKWITDRIGEVPGLLSSIATNIKNTLLAPFQAVMDLIGDIIEKIKKIKPPSIDLNPFNNDKPKSSSSGPSHGSSRAGTSTTNINYNIQTNDPYRAATETQRLQNRRAAVVGGG